MNKKLLISILLMFSFAGYVYFFEYIKNENQVRQKRLESLIAVSEGLERIVVHGESGDYTLGYRDQRWWLEKPVVYPADPSFIEQSLTLMNQVHADSFFELTEDRFGFSPGKGSLNLSYAGGVKKTLILGSETAPGTQIYILNKEAKKVYVVHNVWAQLLYRNHFQLLDPSLPIRNWKVQKIQLTDNDQVLWKLERKGDLWGGHHLGKNVQMDHKKLIWWLRNILSWNVKPEQFNVPRPTEGWFELQVFAEEGKETLLIRKDGELVYIDSLKVIAKIDPFSLKSMNNELKKVIGDGKK